MSQPFTCKVWKGTDFMALHTGQLAKLLLGVWMAGVVVAMFLVIPQYEGLGNAGRIIIMHVPTAWVSVLAFAVSAIYSGLYLWRGRAADDDRALAAAECGLLFTLLATITGAIFSQVVWGIYWNWDPRQTSIFVLLLIYAGMFALRAALDDVDKRRQLGAVYALFAFVTVPFLIFVAPRMADSTLHPNCTFLPGSQCDGVVLQLDGKRIDLLGDRKIELLDLQVQEGTASAQVRVSEPGLTGETILVPTYDLQGGYAADTPTFPGLRYRLTLEEIDTASGTIRLNIAAPGTGTLDNLRTLLTFLASILGFTALFFWLFLVRSTLLGVQWELERREGAFA
jgi:heme exporter protein C